MQLLHMNPVLDIVETCEYDENNEIWLNLRIYHRMKETFFVSFSFIWRRGSPLITMPFCALVV